MKKLPLTGFVKQDPVFVSHDLLFNPKSNGTTLPKWREWLDGLGCNSISGDAHQVFERFKPTNGIEYELVLVVETKPTPFHLGEVISVADSDLLEPAGTEELLLFLKYKYSIVTGSGLPNMNLMWLFASQEVGGKLLNIHMHETDKPQIGGYNATKRLPPGSGLLFKKKK